MPADTCPSMQILYCQKKSIIKLSGRTLTHLNSCRLKLQKTNICLNKMQKHKETGIARF